MLTCHGKEKVIKHFKDNYSAMHFAILSAALQDDFRYWEQECNKLFQDIVMDEKVDEKRLLDSVQDLYASIRMKANFIFRDEESCKSFTEDLAAVYLMDLKMAALEGVMKSVQRSAS